MLTTAYQLSRFNHYLPPRFNFHYSSPRLSTCWTQWSLHCSSRIDRTTRYIPPPVGNFSFNIEGVKNAEHGLLRGSVTRLGDFFNFLATDFLSKVAQMSGDFCSYFVKHHFSSWNCHGYFLGHSWKFWATFYFNLWSHGMQSCQIYHSERYDLR